MFIGHFGAGFAGKKISRNPSLGTLFLASQFIDLLWPFFLLAGWENVEINPGDTAFTPLHFSNYPISHSFLGVLVWAILFGGIYYLLKKDKKSSLLLSGLVMSHWILDLLTHRPDLPLLPWNDFKVGFGLWNSVLFTVLIEGLIFCVGAYLYLSVTKPKSKSGSISFWSLIVFLIVIYISNMFSAPPPSAKAIGVVGLSQWLLIAWGYWIDRSRSVKSS